MCTRGLGHKPKLHNANFEDYCTSVSSTTDRAMSYERPNDKLVPVNINMSSNLLTQKTLKVCLLNRPSHSWWDRWSPYWMSFAFELKQRE